ncbi:hypothetical protein [Falsiroseomonas sp.]|uniref:hypothetical protein n=1 Tax=Falsiroseomonas sp. TaxID=2870721 RepID=UPI003F6E60E9
MLHHPDALEDPAKLSLPRLLAALEGTSTPRLPLDNRPHEDARMSDLDSPLRLEAALTDTWVLGRLPLVFPPVAAAAWVDDVFHLFPLTERLPGGADRLRSIHRVNRAWRARCDAALASPAGRALDGMNRTRLVMLADGLEIGLRFLDRHLTTADVAPLRDGLVELVAGAEFDADPRMISLGFSTWRTVEERDWCTDLVRRSRLHDFRLRRRSWRGRLADTWSVLTGRGLKEWTPGLFAKPTEWTSAEARAAFADHQAAEAARACQARQKAEVRAKADAKATARAERKATKAAERLAEEDAAERKRNARKAARYHRAAERKRRWNDDYRERLG